MLGAALARGFLTGLRAKPPGGDAHWEQVNYADRSVSRLGGPAYALAVCTALPFVTGPVRARTATAIAVTTAAAVGVYDDLVGDTSSRGLAGHGAALASGRVTTGVVKVVALGVGGVTAGAVLRDGWHDVAVAGALVAGAANLANLLDLRPGRAIKASLVPAAAGLPGAAGGPVAAGLGAALALLPDDLGERVMLGDSGAGALGAVLGVGAAASASSRGLRRMLAVVAALNIASEFISFSDVIERVPFLRTIDRIGRR
jgi:UDP-GlcNAc:undecaprenyl-phosphate/decaprenyl-phosphate GlcNAc-1-phosphate transferase